MMKTLYLFLLFVTMSSFAGMSEKPDQWYVVTDRVMGGSSNLEADYDNGTFKMTGNVVKKDGGFVRLAHRPEKISKMQRVSDLKREETMRLMKFI